MKYSVGQVLFCRLDAKNGKGRKVIDAITSRGAYEMPFYKFECQETKSGFCWTPEWMLYTEEEFVDEIKNGTLLSLQTLNNN